MGFGDTLTPAGKPVGIGALDALGSGAFWRGFVSDENSNLELGLVLDENYLSNLEKHGWTVKIWNVGTEQFLRTFKRKGPECRSVALDSMGNSLACGTNSGIVWLWNSRTQIQTLTP